MKEVIADQTIVLKYTIDNQTNILKDSINCKRSHLKPEYHNNQIKCIFFFNIFLIFIHYKVSRFSLSL